MKTLHITIIALLSITLLSSSVVYAEDMMEDGPIQNSTNHVYEDMTDDNETMEEWPIVIQLRAMIAELEAKITELQEDKQNKNAKIAELRDKLKAKTNQSENQDVKLQDKLDRKNAKIAELETALDNKDAKIKHLKEKVDRKIANKQEKVGAMDEKLGVMGEEVDDMKTIINQMNHTEIKYYDDDENGQIHVHRWLNEYGQKIWKSWYRDGQLGTDHGYDENGNMFEYRWWDNGVMAYKMDTSVGKQTWWKNGNLRLVANTTGLIINGSDYSHNNGAWRENTGVWEWFENGNPKEINYVKGGLRVAIDYCYAADGKKYHEMVYNPSNSFDPAYYVKYWYCDPTDQIKVHAFRNATTLHSDLKKWHDNGQMKWHIFKEGKNSIWIQWDADGDKIREGCTNNSRPDFNLRYIPCK